MLASMAVVADCDLFISDDFALLHAAAALGTLYIGIFGAICPANYRHASGSRPVEPLLTCEPVPLSYRLSPSLSHPQPRRRVVIRYAISLLHIMLNTDMILQYECHG